MTERVAFDASHEALWSAVDGFAAAHCLAEDAALLGKLEAGQRASDEAGLPTIQVSAALGKLLMLLVKLSGGRRVLEIGTLGGYSTGWLAAGLCEGGRMVTLELDETHARVARENIGRCGFGDRVEVRQGDALVSLDAMVGDEVTGEAERFDLAFIDADKERIPDYLERCVQLVRPGGVIVVDNVVRGGDVIDADADESRVLGVRRMFEQLRNHPRLTSTTMQMVGDKGYDGFLLALVR
jgi:predicted O-methyltransferase YrrM